MASHVIYTIQKVKWKNPEINLKILKLYLLLKEPRSIEYGHLFVAAANAMLEFDRFICYLLKILYKFGFDRLIYVIRSILLETRSETRWRSY